MLSKTKKSKKAVSVIVGYVLLITFAIIIGALTYAWIKTYVPSQQNVGCQDGVSIFVKNSAYNSTTFELKVTLKNTGRFNLAAYFIHATNESSQELATIDLSGYLDESQGGEIFGNSILFSPAGGNFLASGEEVDHVFNIPLELGTLHSVKVTPARFQEVGDREKFISCESSRMEQVIGEDIGVGGETGASCPDECELTTPYCLEGLCVECIETSQCGGIDVCINNICTPICDPPCGGSLPYCLVGSCVQCIDASDCSGADFCVDNVCTPDCTPEAYSVTCGSMVCGFPINNCGEVVECLPGCEEVGAICNLDGSQCICDVGYELIGSSCVLSCGDGNLDSGEECDSGTGCIAPGEVNECQCPTANHISDGNSPPGCTLAGNGICDSVETCADSDCEGEQAQCPAGICTSGTCVSGGAPSCINYCLGLELGYTTSNCPANTGQCNSQDGNTHGTGPGLGGYDECTLSGATGNYVCCCKPAV